MASKKTLNLDNLQALGARRLAELLLELAAGDAAAKRRLRLELSAEAGPEAVAADIGKRLATLRQARSFVDWQKRPAFVKDLDRQRRLILDKVAEDRPDLALELMWRFMALAGPVQERVDDSRGDVGDVFRQACRDLGAVAARASPDPARLADRVFEAVTANDYGEYDRLVAVVLPALGAAGVARLKERLTAALAARPRAKGGYDATAGALRRALQDVADHEGDVDAFVRHEEGRRSPQRAAAIATRLLAAGRVDEALAALERGAPAELSLRDLEELWAFSLEEVGAGDWDRAWVAALLAAGRQRRRSGSAGGGSRPGSTPSTCARTSRRCRTSRTSRRSGRRSSTRWRSRTSAWRWSSSSTGRRCARRPGWCWSGGARSTATCTSCSTRRRRRSRAGTRWRRCCCGGRWSRTRLDGAKSTRYRHAARHLLECRGLEAGIGERGGVETHEAFVARLRARHGRKAGFWERVAELDGASGRR